MRELLLRLAFPQPRCSVVSGPPPLLRLNLHPTRLPPGAKLHSNRCPRYCVTPARSREGARGAIRAEQLHQQMRWDEIKSDQIRVQQPREWQISKAVYFNLLQFDALAERLLPVKSLLSNSNSCCFFFLSAIRICIMTVCKETNVMKVKAALKP